MKKIILLVGVFVALNCSAQQPPASAEEARTFVATQLPLAKSGQIKWSEYFKGLYPRMAGLNAPGDMLGRIAGLIRDAERYEAGQIDATEFDYRRRSAQAEEASASQARQDAASEQALADERDAQAREQQRSSTVLATAAQLLQASGPRTLAPTPSLTPAGGMMGFLQAQSTSGTLRYCKYSNGVVSTVNIVNLCPLNTQ